MKTWPRFSNSEKRKKSLSKYKKEKEGIEKLILKLPPNLKKEIKTLWLDYEKGLTPEGRFLSRQIGWKISYKLTNIGKSTKIPL